MATPLILVAASGLAREVLALVRAHGGYEVVGFLDDDVARHGTTLDGVPVLGGLDAVTEHPEAELLVCAGKGASREQIVDRLDELGVFPIRYTTVVHPTVDVPSGCEVGVGSIVLAGVALTAAVTVGSHVVVMPNATLTHDCVLQDFSTVCAGVTLGGSVVVGRAAYLGMNASVRENVRVGQGATLGMGAALLQDQPDRATWVGVPARPLGAASGVARHRTDRWPATGELSESVDEGARA